MAFVKGQSANQRPLEVRRGHLQSQNTEDPINPEVLERENRSAVRQHPSASDQLISLSVCEGALGGPSGSSNIFSCDTLRGCFPDFYCFNMFLVFLCMYVCFFAFVLVVLLLNKSSTGRNSLSTGEFLKATPRPNGFLLQL